MTTETADPSHELVIQRPCPSCSSQKTLHINNNSIHCQNCEFKRLFRCPLCDHSLENSTLKSSEQGPYYKCESCHKDIHLKRIQNLMTNLMQISHDHRCKLCNGPTIYRTQANIGHRCFYFPKCSGQSSLFETKRESLVFIDFETTGLEPGKDFIIEIGALKIDTDGFEHTFDTFIKPPIKLPEKIIKITKITDDMLKDAPNMDKVIHDLYQFIGDSTIVAHNAEFDVTWLIMEYMKYNLPIENNKTICTFIWAQKMKESRCSLSALTKKYKIGHLNAHRALADASVTKELFFIYEEAQLVAQPIKMITGYLNTVEKIKASNKSRKNIPVAIPS